MTDVVVVGAGGAGIAVARQLTSEFGMSVVVVERSQRASADLSREGIGMRVGAQVVSVQSGADGTLYVNTVGTAGPDRVAARAVVLATGARERTLAGRMIASARLTGVVTATELRAGGAPAGRRAVVLGGDREAFAAMRSLRLHGGRAQAVVTPWPRHQAGTWSYWLARLLHVFTLHTDAYVTRVHGHDQVTGVELTYRDGRTVNLDCDGLLLTGDWVPEYELAMRSGLVMDRTTGGPAADTGGRTSRAGMFAVGSLIAPGAAAQQATANASSVANAVADYVATGEWFRGIPVDIAAPIDWVAPALAVPLESEGRFVLSATTLRDEAAVIVRQGDRVLGTYDVGSVTPGVPFDIPASWCASVAGDGPDVDVRFAAPA